MKIYSKFQDYYDSALGSFIESDVTYNRNTEWDSVSIKDVPLLGGEFFPVYNTYSEIAGKTVQIENRLVLIGFCGKYYYGLCDMDSINDDDAEPVIDFVNQYISFEEFEEARMHPWKHLLDDKFSKFLKKQNIELFNPEKTDWWKDEAFEKYGPVFIVIYPKISRYTSWYKKEPKIRIIKNPCLKNIAFSHILDPFMCLYHINEWLDSHARPDDAVVPVGDDITRLQAYGFDKKTSFRKPKEKNRK